MASGKIKDPNPPQAMAKGFKIHKGDYVDILKMGVLECDDCSTENDPVEHIYLDNLAGKFTHGKTVKFDHADFDPAHTKMKIAINLK